MPLILIDWIEGRSQEQKRQIVKEFTEVISRVAHVDAQHVRIFFTDHPKEDYAIAGKLLSDQ
jgi:4-oxalocrotonate tautomerase